MKEFSRKQRVGEQIQRELANIIRREISSPQLGMLTIYEVDISPDLKFARVYVTTLGGKLGVKESMQYLNKAAGKLRYHLSQCLKTRTTPRLLFVYDSSIEYGSRLSALIDSVASEDQEEKHG
jgi:ribosome-binding factor A